MGYMFAECNSLSGLDLTSFNTSNVTDMSCMFLACSNLTNIDLSGFDLSKVKHTDYMFENALPCRKA